MSDQTPTKGKNISVLTFVYANELAHASTLCTNICLICK